MHESKQHVTSWTLINEHGLELYGNTHMPNSPTACAIILHGFKGYKDYGFIPVLASRLADAGVLVHRFNFSTSGMTNDTDTFARPDLFSLDTWSRQIDDVRRVVHAVRSDELTGKDLPISLIGHSRGGATAILAGGNHASELDLAGIVTLNAVDDCCRLSDEMHRELLQVGYIFTESARTKQKLRINSAWLQEQLDNPADHDVLGACARIHTDAHTAMLVMHGDKDEAVDVQAGSDIAKAARVSLTLIEGANHVLNTQNPADCSENESLQLKFVIANILTFLSSNTENCRP